MSLVVFQFLRQEALVAHQPVVDERDTGNPVAVFNFSAALYVVLASGEVPHEVAPVHPVEMVGEEELNIIQQFVTKETNKETLAKDIDMMPAWMKRIIKPMLTA